MRWDLLIVIGGVKVEILPGIMNATMIYRPFASVSVLWNHTYNQGYHVEPIKEKYVIYPLSLEIRNM